MVFHAIVRGRADVSSRAEPFTVVRLWKKKLAINFILCMVKGMEKRRKKRRNIYLDEQTFDFCAEWLRGRGVTISAFFDAAMLELESFIKDEATLLETLGNRQIDDLSIKEFSSLVKLWNAKGLELMDRKKERKK